MSSIYIDPTRWMEEHKWPCKPHERYPWGKRFLTTHSIMSGAGVWQLELEVIYSIDWKGGDRIRPQQHHSVPLGHPFLKIFDWPPPEDNANSTAEPGQHQKAHNDVNDIPLHQNPLPVWVEQIYFHTLTACPHHSTLLMNWTGRPLPGDGAAKVMLSEGTPTPTHATSTGPASKALLQKARPNKASKASINELTCTPTHQIWTNCVVYLLIIHFRW